LNEKIAKIIVFSIILIRIYLYGSHKISHKDIKLESVFQVKEMKEKLVDFNPTKQIMKKIENLNNSDWNEDFYLELEIA